MQILRPHINFSGGDDDNYMLEKNNSDDWKVGDQVRVKLNNYKNGEVLAVDYRHRMVFVMLYGYHHHPFDGEFVEDTTMWFSFDNENLYKYGIPVIEY